MMARTPTADVVIVGCGIAGATLAETLTYRGMKVVVVDSPLRPAATRGAGLIAPVAGRRFGVLEDWQAWWNAAIGLYERHGVVDSIRCVRLLYYADELRFWERKQSMLATQGLAQSTELPPWLADAIRPPLAAVEITVRARIRARDYLDSVIAQLTSKSRYCTQTVEISQIAIAHDAAHVADIECAHVVLCEGAWMANTKLFDWVPRMFARGQRISGTVERIPIAEPIWLSVRGKSLVLEPSGRFSFGSNYDWSSSQPTADEQTRAQLELELSSIMCAHVHVDHQWAGVRPIVADLQPVLGRHPQLSNVWIFNGLGSRGLLLAPRLAELLAAAIIDGAAIPRQWDVARFADRIEHGSTM
jgi:glycine/D-amino acid oxidase-like deaminating enzyme